MNLLVALFLCKEFHFLVPGGFNINVVGNVILRAVDNTDVSTLKRQLFALKDILKDIEIKSPFRVFQKFTRIVNKV